MANSRFAYVKNFELPDPLLPGMFTIFRLDGHSFHRFSEEHEFSKPNDLRALELMDHAARSLMEAYPDIMLAFGESDEYSFLLRKSTALYNRRQAKIVSTLTSFFTSCYVFNWSRFFPDTPLKYPPSFDGRIVLYPGEKEIKDYFSWRQADTHINNLYNTTFWALVQKGGQTATEAHATLKGTISKDKNEILFSRFGINYNQISERFKKGSVLVREPITLPAVDNVPHPEATEGTSPSPIQQNATKAPNPPSQASTSSPAPRRHPASSASPPLSSLPTPAPPSPIPIPVKIEVEDGKVIGPSSGFGSDHADQQRQLLSATAIGVGVDAERRSDGASVVPPTSHSLSAPSLEDQVAGIRGLPVSVSVSASHGDTSQGQADNEGIASSPNGSRENNSGMGDKNPDTPSNRLVDHSKEGGGGSVARTGLRSDNPPNVGLGGGTDAGGIVPTPMSVSGTGPVVEPGSGSASMLQVQAGGGGASSIPTIAAVPAPDANYSSNRNGRAKAAKEDKGSKKKKGGDGSKSETRIELLHCDIIRDEFWVERPWLLAD
ncbi:hypothetical protein AX16_007526 [Volvariella volvacea WC 439]|nr:hypothetical protein AX16_007526 [Volvariella volvacea WC 439]